MPIDTVSVYNKYTLKFYGKPTKEKKHKIH